MLQSLNTAATHPQDDPVAVGIAGLSKRFGHVVAVQNVSIDIERGSFVSLLGPSGCGKTTVLRAIAGLERPDEGSIRIGDEVVNDLPVWQRNIGMVFQNYALFPHMSVADNVGFGLRVRGAPASERRARRAASPRGPCRPPSRRPPGPPCPTARRAARPPRGSSRPSRALAAGAPCGRAASACSRPRRGCAPASGCRSPRLRAPSPAGWRRPSRGRAT